MERLTLERISIDPAVMSGQPCVRGTRITVKRVLYVLAECRNREEIYKDFPRFGGRGHPAGAALRGDLAARRPSDRCISSAGSGCRSRKILDTSPRSPQTIERDDC